jgi:hypothetical protein
MLLGCGSETASNASHERVGSAKQSIVGGSTSTAAQDAAVLLAKPNELCTGTLIAPNLVLTARHCIASTPKGDDECVTYGATVAASTVDVYLGVNANPDIHTNSRLVAKGKRITVPTKSNMCSFDVALVELDRDVTGAKIAEVRFTALAPNETTTAVGYGVDGNDREQSQRKQRTTKVIGVGPSTVPYTTKGGLSVKYNAPQGDVVTGESTCFGDSGGPLFDAQGRVIAVTSRGIPQLFPEDKAAFGNGCIDQPSVYAGVRFNEELIRQAAEAAGHILPPTEAEPGDSNASEDDGNVDPSSKGADGGDDEAPKKKSRSTAVMQTEPSCASASGTTNGGASWLLVVGVALFAGARRSRRHGESGPSATKSC